MARQAEDHEGLQAAPAPESAGLQSTYRDANDAPQLVFEAPQLNIGAQHKELVHSQTYTDPLPSAQLIGIEGTKSQRVSRRCWRWSLRRMVIVVTVVVIVVVVAIAVPVTLTKNRSDSTDLPPSSVPSSLSTNGTFYNTGIGARGSDVGPEVAADPSILFFQHFDGDIWQTTSGDTEYIGSLVSGARVKNGTPIAATTYGTGPNLVRHIVYLDPNSKLQDLKEVNESGLWQPGSLGSDFQASSSSGLSIVAIQTIRTGESSPGPAGLPLSSVKIYFGGEDQRIHELTLAENATNWEETYVFPPAINGDSGFHASQPDNNTYLIGTDTKSSLVWYYKETFPLEVGDWKAGLAAPVTLHPNSSVGMISASLVIFQDQTESVRSIDFASQNPSAPWGISHFIDKAIPGTRFAMFLDSDKSNGLLMQPDRNTVSLYKQSPSNSTWSGASIEVR